MIAAHLPVLSHAMTHVAHLAIRNRGTIGGSLSHADPAAELPMMALLLDAELDIGSASWSRARSRRATSSCDALSVDLAEDEIVTEIVLPKLPPQTGWGFEEVARRSGDFALAAVAATLTVADGAIAQARIAMTRRRADTRERAAEAETLLVGHALEPRADRCGHRGRARGHRAADRPACLRRTIGVISSACWPAGRSPPHGDARRNAA